MGWDIFQQGAYTRILQSGFSLVKNSEKELLFARENIRISITIDPYTYEIEAFFENVSCGITIRLLDALRFCNLSHIMGLYQFSSKSKISKGIAVILESIALVIEQNQTSLDTFICNVDNCLQKRKKEQI